MCRQLLQSERNAELLIDVLRSLVKERKFKLRDFVVMPDHVHLLITVENGTTIEKAMQLIKGRFSYRLSKEFGYLGEVWQRGYSEVQVLNKDSVTRYRAYIANNPVKAGLAKIPGQFPYCFQRLAEKKGGLSSIQAGKACAQRGQEGSPELPRNADKTCPHRANTGERFADRLAQQSNR
jgi:putative transposase